MESQNYLSAEFPFQSKYVTVHGAKMHYIEQGSGETVLFIHGIPTYSYVWRNVIPYVAPSAHCIALDLIGCGYSDKPDIDYTLPEHMHYLEGFIENLKLKDITLVLHGWGSILGFDLAMRRPDLIKKLIFMEAHIRPVVDWNDLSLPVQQLSSLLDKDADYAKILNTNFYMEKIFPLGVLRKLGKTEMDFYLKPFAEPASKKVLIQYLQDLPFTQHPPNNATKMIAAYSEKLQQSTMPKLMLYAVPGFLTTINEVQWAITHLPNLRAVDIGEDLHYLQETKPDIIGHEIGKWLREG